MHLTYHIVKLITLIYI